MRKSLLLAIGLILLLSIEILRVYFIMPFPGSQRANTINVAYFIDRNILWLRLLAVAVTVPPLIYFLTHGRMWQKITLIVLIGVYGFIFYMFNFRFLADKMFHQMKEKTFFAAASDTTNRNKLVIGVVSNGAAKAYPIEILGYHHQVIDTVGTTPVMVTYCTVCRTGRVYSPFVSDHFERFRLVGMDHFNAMFEDATTKSWWQQATGKAIAGKLKGAQLPEIPSAQMSLADWLTVHPNSQVLQRDSNFNVKYDSLRGYDEGTISGSLEKRDTASWKFKSWVIGVNYHAVSKAYDWNQLVRQRIINDTIAHQPVLITVTDDNRSFYVLAHADSLHFVADPSGMIRKTRTNTIWKPAGQCVSGTLNGTALQPIQAYQEFWHSWRTFHPNTLRYN